jgi:hypothetical protein
MEEHRLAVDVERVLGEPSYLEDSKMALSLSSMPVRAMPIPLSSTAIWLISSRPDRRQYSSPRWTWPQAMPTSPTVAATNSVW